MPVIVEENQIQLEIVEENKNEQLILRAAFIKKD